MSVDKMNMNIQDFKAKFRCYFVNFFEKKKLDFGNKVVMPPTVFKTIVNLGLKYPLMFEIENCKNRIISHCGVLEFSSNEGMVYLPSSMMQNLSLADGDVISMRSVLIPLGTYVKIKPHSKEFLNIEDHKTVLEQSLRNYSCLTTGESIIINHNEINYWVDILATKPDKAISLIETVCRVDLVESNDFNDEDSLEKTMITYTDHNVLTRKTKKQLKLINLNKTSIEKSIQIPNRLNGNSIS
jgi:ubiquitin fusion degradation protein 1